MVAADLRQRPHVGEQPHLVLAELGGRDGVVDELGEVELTEAEAEGARLDPGGVEHVADQLGEPVRLAGDQLEEGLALIRGQLPPALLQRPGRSDHGRHRRAQLV